MFSNFFLIFFFFLIGGAVRITGLIASGNWMFEGLFCSAALSSVARQDTPKYMMDGIFFSLVVRALICSAVFKLIWSGTIMRFLKIYHFFIKVSGYCCLGNQGKMQGFLLSKKTSIKFGISALKA